METWRSDTFHHSQSKGWYGSSQSRFHGGRNYPLLLGAIASHAEGGPSGEGYSFGRNSHGIKLSFCLKLVDWVVLRGRKFFPETGLVLFP